MLHTGNGDEKSHYFFTAEEIVNEFRLDKDEEHYVFRITKKKCFSDYKNRSHKEIVDKINTGIQFSSRVNNAKFIERIYRIYRIPTQHNLSEPEFIYKLRREEEHAFVLVHNVKPGHTERHLLEYRRDLFVNLGSFEWGYIGDGSYFLATCILAHHLNGAKPAVSSVKKLQIYLSDLDRDQTHDVTTQTIELVLDS
ncbi:hypothetical protein [Vibrio parahaemolyticus]|uniref:hypothetical protein n=1 Tax=Vibrio parahaemolyticus TaxID=670 RepID=UPI00040A5E52|nr:hypothetical protein [Vibrio parahaemolyticus]